MMDLGADSEEKHEPASDIDIVVVESLKVLGREWPIREATAERTRRNVGLVPKSDIMRVELSRSGGPILSIR
jgi:hypothetical protein